MPVKKATVNLPVRLKGHAKLIFSNILLNPLGAQNNDLFAASQTLLTGGPLSLVFNGGNFCIQVIISRNLSALCF